MGTNELFLSQKSSKEKIQVAIFAQHDKHIIYNKIFVTLCGYAFVDFVCL